MGGPKGSTQMICRRACQLIPPPSIAVGNSIWSIACADTTAFIGGCWTSADRIFQMMANFWAISGRASM